MALDKMVSSKIDVIGANKLQLTPGGHYNMADCGQAEAAIVRLSVLRNHIDMMIESWSYSGENNLRLNKQIEPLAEELYLEYESYIEQGIDPFKFEGFYIENADLRELHVLKQKNELATFGRRSLYNLLASNFDISRTFTEDFTYIYLHDLQELTGAMIYCLNDFEGFAGAEIADDCVCVKVSNLTWND